jgi:uncharacterized membrane protein
MLDKIQSLQKMQLIKVQDAAIVTWPEGAKAPKTRQLVSMAGVGALQGAFWGMLFGLIFFIPFFGLAIGAAMGALSGKMADYGICLLYTSPSPRDRQKSRMPSSA